MCIQNKYKISYNLLFENYTHVTAQFILYSIINFPKDQD